MKVIILAILLLVSVQKEKGVYDRLSGIFIKKSESHSIAIKINRDGTFGGYKSIYDLIYSYSGKWSPIGKDSIQLKDIVNQNVVLQFKVIDDTMLLYGVDTLKRVQ
jgi:hypothetical protein